ncbi:MAG: hypothetical protein R3E02_01890 [Blastomonas sp.]
MTRKITLLESDPLDMHQAGQAAAQRRLKAIAEHPATAGREVMALQCLSCFPDATAAEITAFLSRQPLPKAGKAEGEAELSNLIAFNAANLN